MVALTKRTQDQSGLNATSNSLLRLSRTPESVSYAPIVLDLPLATTDQVASALRADNFIRYDSVQENTNFFSMAEYYSINPAGLQTPELELIRSLDLSIIEELRRTGLLLYNPNTGEYYLMSTFNGKLIDPEGLINLINQVIIAIKSSIQVARRTNGLEKGVVEGDIRDINAYLAVHGFTRGNPNKLLLKKIESIFNNIILESEQSAQASVQIESAQEAYTFEDIVSLFIHKRQFKMSGFEIAQIIVNNFPEVKARRELFDYLFTNLPDDQRVLLLETMDGTGDFVWSKVPIDTLEKVEALIPPERESDQINLGQILQSQVCYPIIKFLEDHPEWLMHYGLIVAYIRKRLEKLMNSYGISYSTQNSEKIGSVITQSLRKHFRHQFAELETEG